MTLNRLIALILVFDKLFRSSLAPINISEIRRHYFSSNPKIIEKIKIKVLNVLESAESQHAIMTHGMGYGCRV